MATTEDLMRFVLRALGAILMISGGLETLLGFTLGMVLIQPAFAHPTPKKLSAKGESRRAKSSPESCNTLSLFRSGQTPRYSQ